MNKVYCWRWFFSITCDLFEVDIECICRNIFSESCLSYAWSSIYIKLNLKDELLKYLHDLIDVNNWKTYGANHRSQWTKLNRVDFLFLFLTYASLQATIHCFKMHWHFFINHFLKKCYLQCCRIVCLFFDYLLKGLTWVFFANNLLVGSTIVCLIYF
jgi:hypothetical protein